MLSILYRKDINKLKTWFFGCPIKRVWKSSDDFHIDYRGESKKQKDWIGKALYFFLIACIANEEFQIPWNFLLVYCLKNKSKSIDVEFANKKQFFKEMNVNTPPSVYWSGQEIFSDFINNFTKSLFPKNFAVNFHEFYDEENGCYFRYLKVAINRKNIFNVILSKIFDKRIFKLNLNTLEDKISLRRIEKLKLELKKDPGNINLVVELAVLTFLASNLEEALVYLDSFKKKYPNNGEVYFWKTILTYYCNCQVAQKTHCEHLKKAKSLLENGIKVEPNNPKCLSFLFRLVWRETKSFEKAIKYMKKVKKIAPDWITPRIQLARYYLYEFDELDRKEALELLKKELEELSLVNWKKFGGKKNFREKYLTAYFTGKTKENRTVVLELMRWYYGIKRFKIKNISKEDKKFLKKAGLKYKILDE